MNASSGTLLMERNEGSLEVKKKKKKKVSFTNLEHASVKQRQMKGEKKNFKSDPMMSV